MIQPIGFSGRREATSAPTVAKVTTNSALATSVEASSPSSEASANTP